jgi:hypothetical protein
LSANVLTVSPVPGLRYDSCDLTNVDAVLHGTYHSFTAPSSADGLPMLARNAERLNVPVYIAPILSSGELYGSTADIAACENVTPLYDMTFEMAYVALLLAFS